MNYSNVSFLGVSAFLNETFSSLFVCTRFGGHPLFLSFLSHARLSWDRDRVTGLALRTWPRKDQAHTEIWGEIPQLHSVWGHVSLLLALPASKTPHLPLRRQWSTQGGTRIKLQTPNIPKQPQNHSCARSPFAESFHFIGSWVLLHYMS